MNFLLDTNVLIDYLEGIEPRKSFLQKYLFEDVLYISPVTIAELRPRTSKTDQEKLEEFIHQGKVVYVDLEIGFAAGEYRGQFATKTKKVYLIDCLIAATCKVHNLTLITNNVKDYPMKDIKILKPS